MALTETFCCHLAVDPFTADLKRLVHSSPQFKAGTRAKVTSFSDELTRLLLPLQAIKMHTNYRGSQEWRKLGIPLTTGSEEACKMFDAIITQTLGWCNDDRLGGMEGTFIKMKQADPDFVMGSVWGNWLELASNGRVMNGNDGLSEEIARMVALSKTTPGITTRECKHVQAVELWSQGHLDRAANVWEDILVDNPLDPCAIHMAYNTYLFRGKGIQIRDTLAQVLPYWKPTMPNYGYLLGLYAYGLEESNMFSLAEDAARKALSINPRDAWSTHTLCHVMEMTGRQEEEIYMLEKSQPYWEHGVNLACHNYWHWALNNVELGEYETALSIFDDQLTTRLSNGGSVFNLADVTSLLYRLEMEGVNLGDRWAQVSTMYKDHKDDHVFAFNDLHIFMACLNSKEEGLADEMMKSVQDFIREGKGDTRNIMAEVGEDMMKGFAAYKEGDFATAVNLINPIRYRVREMGGSNAQRDVFSLFLINAAIRSPEKRHHKLARNLLNERKALIPHAPMTDRLMAKVVELHAD